MFFPSKLVVWFRWPPQDRREADTVLDAIAAARVTDKDDPGTPVCRVESHAFQMPDQSVIAALLEKHANFTGWNPPLPISCIPRYRAEPGADKRALNERDEYEIEQMPHVILYPKRETAAEYSVRVKEWRRQSGG